LRTPHRRPGHRCYQTTHLLPVYWRGLLLAAELMQLSLNARIVIAVKDIVDDMVLLTHVFETVDGIACQEPEEVVLHVGSCLTIQNIKWCPTVVPHRGGGLG